MTIAITHPFVSAKGDGGDATLVRPSNWNANHTTSMATNNILGRATAGAGSFEELPTSAFIIAALNSANAAEFLAKLGVGAFESGDVKFSINPTAPDGWIAYNGEGTIGKTGSAATIRANDDCGTLYGTIYNNISDTYCPVSGGRSGNATTDFVAGKTIAMPRFSGRAIIGAGLGSGLTNRNMGVYSGEESHALTGAENGPHTHPNFLTDLTHTHNYTGVVANQSASGAGNAMLGIAANSTTANNSTPMSLTNASSGSGTAHNNMQPYIPMWVKVKL